jgi:hypothetical protein
MVTVHRRALMTAVVAFALAGSSGSVSGKGQQLTETFCREPATQRSVGAEARRQRLLSAPLQIKAVRFEYLETTRLGSFCAFSVVTGQGEIFEFAVTPTGERGGVRRFKFQHLD